MKKKDIIIPRDEKRLESKEENKSEFKKALIWCGTISFFAILIMVVSTGASMILYKSTLDTSMKKVDEMFRVK